MQVKKHPNVRLSSWSPIFFLTGLAIMLFISYQMIEWKTFEKDDLAGHESVLNSDLETVVPITNQVTPPPPPPPPPAASQVIEVIDDNLEIEEAIIESSEIDQTLEITEITKIEDIIEEEEEEEIADVPFSVIEDVPIYPGCEKATTNALRKSCMEEKVMAYIQKNFDTELANELGLEGRQRINVQFKIDKEGHVVNVRARAPHPRLEREAILLVQKMPKMIPGKQRGRPVGVIYNLPILFKVET